MIFFFFQSIVYDRNAYFSPRVKNKKSKKRSRLVTLARKNGNAFLRSSQKNDLREKTTRTTTTTTTTTEWKREWHRRQASTPRTNRTCLPRINVGARKAIGTWRNPWTWCLKIKRKWRRVQFRRMATYAETIKIGRWGWKKNTRSSFQTRRISRRDRRIGRRTETKTTTGRIEMTCLFIYYLPLLLISIFILWCTIIQSVH